MELFDTLKSAVQRLLGRKEQNKLHRVTDEERKNAIIKERSDLCVSLNSEPTPQTVRRDDSRDISFLGWQVANVEERSPIDNRRICYLKLFHTRYDKFVCQRMTLIDDEEKSYAAHTADTLEEARAFFGDDALTLALFALHAKQLAAAEAEKKAHAGV